MPSPQANNTVVDLDSLNALGKELLCEFYQIFSEIPLVGGAVARVMAPAAAALVTATVGGLLVVIGVLLPLLNPIVTVVFGIINGIRSEGGPEFDRIINDTLGEMFGVEFKETSFTKATGAAGALARAHDTGSKVMGLLTREFGGKVQDQPGPGERAMQAFAGFSVNFAVTNSVLSLLADSLSLHEINQLRELGAQGAHNLGLSRAIHHAMSPLIDALIVKPFTKELNALYTPNRISIPTLVRSSYRGKIDRARLGSELQLEGYPTFYHDDLIQDATLHVDSLGLGRLERYGSVTANGAIEELQREGWPVDAARLKMLSEDQARADRWVDESLAALVGSLEQGWIAPEDFRRLADEFPIGDVEKTWLLRAAGFKIENPAKRLTLAEVLFLYEQAQVDLDYVNAWTAAERYSQQDQFLLESYVLLKTNQSLDKKKKKPPKPKA